MLGLGGVSKATTGNYKGPHHKGLSSRRGDETDTEEPLGKALGKDSRVCCDVKWGSREGAGAVVVGQVTRECVMREVRLALAFEG